jgi:Helix-turn-helix of insertion element transposase
MKRNETKRRALSAKQLRAIEVLLRTPGLAAAAKILNISRVTLFRWLNNEEFSTEYRRAQKQLLADTMALLRSSGTEAVQILRAVMLGKSTSDAVRVSAARSLIEFNLKMTEQFEHEERLSAIEQRLAELPDARQPGMRRV